MHSPPNNFVRLEAAIDTGNPFDKINLTHKFTKNWKIKIFLLSAALGSFKATKSDF